MTMKLSNRPLYLALFLLAIAVACALTGAGCAGLRQAATPTQRVIAAQDTYSATLTVLTEARRAGLISDAEAVKLEDAREKAAALIDVAKAVVRSPATSPQAKADAEKSAADAADSFATLTAEARR
jgi:hypothetical protein